MEMIRRSPFFGALPDPVFKAIAKRSQLVGIGAGKTLFTQGDTADAVFCVLRGLVKLSIHQSDGTDAVIDVFQPGQSFAEALAFRADSYPASAIALVDSVVFAAPTEVLQSVISKTPEAFPAILAATFSHLHTLVRQIESLKANSGLQRLIQYVLAATEKSAATGPETGTVDIPYEKQVLASLLGMKPETLSRNFRRLEAHGVELDRRQITVRDRKKLLYLLENGRS